MSLFQKQTIPQKKQEKPAQTGSIAAGLFSDQVSISPEAMSKASEKGFLASTELVSAEKPQSSAPDPLKRLDTLLPDIGDSPDALPGSSGGTGGAPDVPPIKDKPRAWTNEGI